MMVGCYGRLSALLNARFAIVPGRIIESEPNQLAYISHTLRLIMIR